MQTAWTGLKALGPKRGEREQDHARGCLLLRSGLRRLSPSTLLCPNFLVAGLSLGWYLFFGRSQRQQLHESGDGKSQAAASRIEQILSAPSAVPVCLCVLSPLENGTQQHFLVQNNFRQGPVSAGDLLGVYMRVCLCVCVLHARARGFEGVCLCVCAPVE